MAAPGLKAAQRLGSGFSAGTTLPILRHCASRRILFRFLDRCVISWMKEQWLQDPLAGYEDNARHLFSYPDSTMHEYGLDLRRFVAWLRERSGEAEAGAKTAEAGGKAAESVALLSCTREKVEDFIACLSSEGLRATTINRKIYSLNSFYVWAVHHQLMPASPLVGVRKLKIPRRTSQVPNFRRYREAAHLHRDR